jgi:soluble lytic murein transglycosylase-like protein
MKKNILFLFLFFLFIIFIKNSYALYNSCFNYASFKYNLPPKLIKAVAKVESNINPSAIDYDSNGSYDYGVMQINTIWYPLIKFEWNNLADPCDNIIFGSWIIKKCAIRYNYNFNRTVTCYHMGAGNIRYKEKLDQKYVQRVAYYYEKN